MATAAATSALDDRIKSAVKKELLKTGKAKSVSMDDLEPVSPISPSVLKSEVEEIKIGPNQKLFSELCGITPEKLRANFDMVDFGVTILKLEDIPEQVRSFIPEEQDNYVLQTEEAAAALMAVEFGDKVLTTGPTGSGKSTMWKQLCALTNRPYIRINSSVDMESATFFGMVVAEKGETPFKDGPITEAVRYGALVCIDEWDVTPAEILFGLQWLFEQDGKLYLKEMPGSSKDKFLTPHENFRMVCCGNTLGQGDESGKHVGTTVQNTATIDRFGTTIQLDYLPAHHEEAMISKAYPSLEAAFISQMVQLAKLVRNAYAQGNITLTISPRTLLNWARKTIQLRGNSRKALLWAYGNKLRDTDKRVLNEMYHKVYGVNLVGIYS